LNFIGLGLDLNVKKGKRKKLEDLFVKPIFSEGKKINNRQLENIFDNDKSIIILGNPGSGKSILTKFITLKTIKKEKTIFTNSDITNRIPFRIELRKYHAFKKEKKGGLLKYLIHLIDLEYAISNILLENLEFILNNKQTLIIFDGLDEIFDINDKLSVKNDIENFIDQYKRTKTITTSRIIGYSDAPLEDKNTIRLTINNFNDNQIEEYIKNWYSIEENNKKIRQKEINDLLEKKDLIDNELISNPLLLSLIVILYRNNLKVPESKLEIYQSCTKTLVDKWDHSKSMEINLSEDIYKRKDTIFADLAYWQYRELSNQDGKVTYQRAKNTVAKSLTEKLKIADDFTSDSQSEEFLLYAQKRSLYFDNNFTHKTFLEYFTAFWIFSNIEKKHKKGERNALIGEYVTNSYWHIVLELLINLIDKDQADNEIIDDLIEYQLKLNVDSSIFFLEIFETIQNVSTRIFEEIVKKIIFVIIHKQEKDIYIFNPSFDLLSKYFRDTYYRKLINKTFENLQSAKINELEITGLNYLYAELILKHSHNIENSHRKENTYTIDKQSEEYKIFNSFPEYISEDSPFLSLFKTLTFEEEEFKKNPIPFMSFFLKKFRDVFSDDLNSKYSGIGYIPFLDIILRNLLIAPDHKLLDKGIKLFEENNILMNEIIKLQFNSSIFYYNNDEKITAIINTLNQTQNKKYKGLIMPILFSLRFNDFTEKKYSNLNNLIGLFSDNNFSNALKFILDENNDSKSVTQYINKYIDKEYNDF